MTTEQKRRGNTTVPVTTIEDVPVLEASERAGLIESLKRAEAEIEDGKGLEYDSKTFKDRLARIYRDKRRS